MALLLARVALGGGVLLDSHQMTLLKRDFYGCLWAMSTKHIKLAPPPFQRQTQLSVLPQVRRGIEYLDPETYAQASYYEKCHGTWDFFFGGRREFLISGSVKCSQCVSKWHFFGYIIFVGRFRSESDRGGGVRSNFTSQSIGENRSTIEVFDLEPPTKNAEQHNKTVGAEVKPAVQHVHNLVDC